MKSLVIMDQIFLVMTIPSVNVELVKCNSTYLDDSSFALIGYISYRFVQANPNATSLEKMSSSMAMVSARLRQTKKRLNRIRSTDSTQTSTKNSENSDEEQNLPNKNKQVKY